MSNRIKAKKLATREEFNAAVQQAADHELMIRYIATRRDRAIQRIQARFGEKIAPLAVERDAQIALAEKYAEEHRKELLPDETKKKSGETPVATFGYRTGNRTVRLLSKVSEENAIATLEALRLDRFVRTVKEIDKAGLLREADDDKNVTRSVHDPVGAEIIDPLTRLPKLELVALSTAGLKITQAETFYVEPKVESAETMKPQEAVSG